jgi:hypothetical protein
MGGPTDFETEANGGSGSTLQLGPFLGWFTGLIKPVEEILVLPMLL